MIPLLEKLGCFMVQAKIGSNYRRLPYIFSPNLPLENKYIKAELGFRFPSLRSQILPSSAWILCLCARPPQIFKVPFVSVLLSSSFPPFLMWVPFFFQIYVQESWWVYLCFFWTELVVAAIYWEVEDGVWLLVPTCQAKVQKVCLWASLPLLQPPTILIRTRIRRNQFPAPLALAYRLVLFPLFWVLPMPSSSFLFCSWSPLYVMVFWSLMVICLKPGL